MSYSLTDETSIDTLIFWILGSDGSISYAEQNAVKRVLDNMKYDMATYQTTLTHIGAMSTENVGKMVNEAISHIKRAFSDDGKKLTYQLLENIANCDGKLTEKERQKLQTIKFELGL